MTSSDTSLFTFYHNFDVYCLCVVYLVGVGVHGPVIVAIYNITWKNMFQQYPKYNYLYT